MNDTNTSPYTAGQGSAPAQAAQTASVQAQYNFDPQTGEPVNKQIAPFDIPDLPTAKPIKRLYSIADAVIAWICFVLAFIFTRYVADYSGGLWGGIFWALFGATSAVYAKLSKLNIKKWHIVVFSVAELFCLTPLFCANGFINFLAACFSFVLMFYLLVSVSGAELFGKHFVRDIFIATLARPFESFGLAFPAAFSVFKGGKRTKNVLYAIIGLVIALPLTVVVLLLLMQSDSAFENVMDNFFDVLPEFNGSLFWQLVFAVPVGLFLFGALFSSKKDYSPAESNGFFRFVPVIVSCTAVTPICLFYLIYIITQLQYFTAAFGGSLPEGYSYSEFARRGFFELCIIAVINLCVIIVIQIFTNRGDKETTPLALRIYTIILSVFTLLLITSASSKMIMYIDEYGMTQLRVYTFWFMMVLAIAFVLIIIAQLKAIPFWRVMFAAFAIMFGILCFGNIDGAIARYNVDNYLNGNIGELDLGYFYDLGFAAAEPTAELIQRGDLDNYVNLNEHTAKSILSEIKTKLEKKDVFAYFSFVRVQAQNAINSIPDEIFIP